VVALSPAAMSGQGIVSPACFETCPNPLVDAAGATACAARISLCQTKLVLYQSYMGQLSTGVSRLSLPALYTQILQPHYPTVPLGGYRYGAGDRQPINNSTTDCTVTFYNPGFAAYTPRLSSGSLTTDGEFQLLFHELAHVEQCFQTGGRDRYATMWFRQAELAFLQTGDLAAIHGIQPMENAARDKAAAVLTATRRNRGSDGRFVTPQPDLLVADIDMVSLDRFGFCTMRLVLENAGSAPVPLAAYSNASAVVRVVAGGTSIGEASLAQLDPDRVLRGTPPRSVSPTWRPGTTYRYNGSRYFVVSLDPNRAVTDANRGNNLRERTVTCTVAPLTVTRPGS
jgi:hypothetical protein